MVIWMRVEEWEGGNAFFILSWKDGQYIIHLLAQYHLRKETCRPDHSLHQTTETFISLDQMGQLMYKTKPKFIPEVNIIPTKTRCGLQSALVKQSNYSSSLLHYHKAVPALRQVQHSAGTDTRDLFVRIVRALPGYRRELPVQKWFFYNATKPNTQPRNLKQTDKESKCCGGSVAYRCSQNPSLQIHQLWRTANDEICLQWRFKLANSDSDDASLNIADNPWGNDI